MVPPHTTAHGSAGHRAPPHPPWEVAEVFRRYGDQYRQSYPVPPAHAQVMAAITSCRTPERGGHVEQCPQCGFERYAYHSCRNRHCPTCQTLTTAQWVEDRKADLLPVPAFHTVEFIPLSFWYDAPLTSQSRDRRHAPWLVYGLPRCSPAQ